MGEHERPAKRSRRKFSDEFKRDAVEIVRSSGRPIAEVARELGIHELYHLPAAITDRLMAAAALTRAYGRSIDVR